MTMKEGDMDAVVENLVALGVPGLVLLCVVLSPAQLEEPLAPALQAHAREELVRSRRLAVLAFPGRKKPRSKGSSTSWSVKHSGHSTSMAVSTPQSTRSNSSTRKSASRMLTGAWDGYGAPSLPPMTACQAIQMR